MKVKEYVFLHFILYVYVIYSEDEVAIMLQEKFEYPAL